MVSVKLKFRPSVVANKKGVLYYQVIYNRRVQQIKTEYRIFPHEWDPDLSEIKIPIEGSSLRLKELLWMKEEIEAHKKYREQALASFVQKKGVITLDDIVFLLKGRRDLTLKTFMKELIFQLEEQGKSRTAETYATTWNSFLRFRKGIDLSLDEINPELMQAYESYLKQRQVSMNTISFYMRILRAVYNRAVEKNLVLQRYPFRYVYTGIEKTIKRAVSLQTIRQIKKTDLSSFPEVEYARDLFLFSFYTRGMAFVDMAFLQKKDLNQGVLSYRRKKTGQLLFIRWEKCMQVIVDKYPSDPSSPYLLPIIRTPYRKERQQYKNAILIMNKALKKLSLKLHLSVSLTTYVARHSWASIARDKNIPLAVISEGMGHASETVTQIYLNSLDHVIVDNANKLILSDL